jgi:hypothetical protein
MTKAHARLLVFSSPRSVSDEREFDDWYDDVHIPQVVEVVPGVISGQRFVLSPTQLGVEVASGPRRRLTIYEVEAGRVAEVVSGLGAALRDGTLDQTELIDRTSAPPEVVVYEAG